MVKEGVRALTEMQLSDGAGAGSAAGASGAIRHTTPWSCMALQIAQQNDVALCPACWKRGVEWLKRYQAEQVPAMKNADQRIDPWKGRADNLDAFVYMVLVDAGVDDGRCESSCTGIETTWPCMPRRCSAWPCTSWETRRSSP